MLKSWQSIWQPPQDRESKTWLGEDTGAITSIDDLIGHAGYFNLNEVQVLLILSELVDAIDTWRAMGAGSHVGLSAHELDEFAQSKLKLGRGRS